MTIRAVGSERRERGYPGRYPLFEEQVSVVGGSVNDVADSVESIEDRLGRQRGRFPFFGDKGDASLKTKGTLPFFDLVRNGTAALGVGTIDSSWWKKAVDQLANNNRKFREKLAA